MLFCVRKKVRKVLKKLLREIDRLEQSKAKKVEQIKMLQDEVNKIDEELKPYYTLKKQYEKLESALPARHPFRA